MVDNGLLFGGFITFINYKPDFKGTNINEDGKFPFQYDAKINTSSIGLMIGYKLTV